MNRVKKRISNNVVIRLGRKLLLALVILGIPVVIFLSAFHTKKLEVVGTKRYTPEQIIDYLVETKADTNSLFLYLKYHYFKQVKLPFVEKIDITMDNPHTITAYVYEKMIAGCVEFMGEYMYFDKDGIVVESSTKRLKDVPIIKGLKFDKILLSEKLEVQKDELFNVIINLTQLIEKYQLGVDTISFSGDYDVTLECGDITVQLGKKSTYDEALSDLKNILKKVSGRKITINLKDYEKGTDRVIGKPKKATE